uniref:GDT1 family protein n=1 Tax=Steinernema glaseri TaxID=37863 RepID=A0A1I7ZUU6_9BILA
MDHNRSEYTLQVTHSARDCPMMTHFGYQDSTSFLTFFSDGENSWRLLLNICFRSMDVVCGVVAGLFAATASVSAKLLFEEWDSFVIKSVCFAAFALSNIMMWWSHTKALRNSASTLKVSIVS